MIMGAGVGCSSAEASSSPPSHIHIARIPTAASTPTIINCFFIPPSIPSPLLLPAAALIGRSPGEIYFTFIAVTHRAQRDRVESHHAKIMQSQKYHQYKKANKQRSH